MTMCVNVKKGLDDDADCAIAGVAMVMMRNWVWRENERVKCVCGDIKSESHTVIRDFLSILRIILQNSWHPWESKHLKTKKVNKTYWELVEDVK